MKTAKQIIPPINLVPKYKNANGETIWKIVESRNVGAKKRKSELRLHWGKLPTDNLLNLKLKYNQAARAGDGKAVGKIWSKINELKAGLKKNQQVRRADKKPVGRPPQVKREPVNPFSGFVSYIAKAESQLLKWESTGSSLNDASKTETLLMVESITRRIATRHALAAQLLKDRGEKVVT